MHDLLIIRCVILACNIITDYCVVFILLSIICLYCEEILGLISIFVIIIQIQYKIMMRPNYLWILTSKSIFIYIQNINNKKS